MDQPLEVPNLQFIDELYSQELKSINQNYPNHSMPNLCSLMPSKFAVGHD